MLQSRQVGANGGHADGDRSERAEGDPFITLGGEPYLIRYNSRLPIVVYAPSDVEVRYRIWRASPEVKMMGKG